MNVHRMRRHIRREPPHVAREYDATGNLAAVYLLRGEWPNVEPRFPELKRWTEGNR